MRFLHALRANRKGAGIEMAIMLLVVTFALSTLVLSTSLLQRTRENKAVYNMEQGICLEQIGQRFCDAVAQGDTTHTWVEIYPDYVIAVSDLTMTVSDEENGEILLTVALTAGEDGYTIATWNKK